MNAVLDSIWQAHLHASGALKVVRRVAAASLESVMIPGLRGRLLAGSGFEGLSREAVDARLDEIQEHLDDQTVLMLYAAFESEIRDHLIAQSRHLRSHATRPDGAFAAALADHYEAWCEEWRMDKVAGLYAGAVGEVLVGQVGQVRKYRHWVAHGKRWQKPSLTTPTFAYQTLNSFLAKI